MPVFTDMTGREIVLDRRPERIVSLVPSQTELLSDFGLNDEVVGITKFCVHPEHWYRSKARVGGTKTVNLEQVRALRPDLIIANKEENVRDQVAELEQIAPVWTSDIKNLDDALVMIRNLGEVLGKAPEANRLADQVAGDFSSLKNEPLLQHHRTAYAIWYKPWMWAGGDTFISDVLGHCGLENVLQKIERYPAMDLQQLSGLNPSLLLLSSEPFPFKEKHILELSATFPDARIELVDGELFSWYGSRLLKSVPYLKSLLARL